jgi:shikimate dehydrogenase
MTQPKTFNFGLTGFPLGHSLSPKIHAAALKAAGLDGEYKLYPVSPDDPVALAALINRLRAGELHGLNVTIPHKQTVIPLLDDLTSSARSIGAVNTIFVKDGKLIGHNTDAPGFLGDLARLLEKSKIQNRKSAIVLGAGGAARAVVAALLSDGWQVTLAVRDADLEQAQILAASHSLPIAYLSLSELSTLDLSNIALVVNTTPLGMSPAIDTCAWPEALNFPPQAAVYDCVYNPRETLLVKRARAAGLKAETGLGMLLEQAALAFEIWTGATADLEATRKAVE